MTLKRIIYIILVLITWPVFGQIKQTGTPLILNYPKSVYNAGTQNWAISQDERGFMYFANSEGVIIFDGIRWTRVEISASKPIRSLFIDDDNTIYIGFLNDFGILEPGSNGTYIFRSLRKRIPEGITDFDDIWRIHKIPQGIVFQTYEYFFVLNNGTIETIVPELKFHFSFVMDDRLFIQEPGIGLFEYNSGRLIKLPYSSTIRNMEIIAMIDRGNGSYLICTSGNGIFEYTDGRLEKWQVRVTAFTEKARLYSAIEITEGHLAFGTILKGLVIADADGNILQHINKKEGLQNSTVLSLFLDRSENLWLGLDNGIDYIEINSPITFIKEFESLGTGYCATVFDHMLYLGTNQGLYARSFKNDIYYGHEFELVEHTAGQVWSLNVFDNQLLCNHNSGTFIIEGKTGRRISREEGAWRYIRSMEDAGMLIGGHYNGLVMLKLREGRWTFHHKIKGFNESSRFLQQSANGDIWISHGAKGVFRLKLNEEMDSVMDHRLYNARSGLPSDERNIIYKLNGEVFVSTMEGCYIYDESSDRFIYSGQLNAIFDFEGRLKTFSKDETGNIWYIAEHESGLLRLNEDNTYTKITIPFKPLDRMYINEFESIYPYNKDHIITGIDNGFAHYSSSRPKRYSDPYPAYITKVELPYMDSVIHPVLQKTDPETTVFPFSRNTFRFYFTSPFYEGLQNLEFSYLLEEFNDQWSAWTATAFKDYTNLTEGIYTFKVKARNIYGVESETDTFQFTIDPPFYRSKAAYYLYALIILILLFITIMFVRYSNRMARKKAEIKHQEELKKKEEQFEHQALIAEKEIIRLRNEKLRSEMIHKDKELANQTMNIIQKNKLLHKLKEEISLLMNSSEDPRVKTKLLVIKRKLEKEIDNKKQNQVFKDYFEEVHDDFFNRLKQTHPTLSARDLHLCAYIKMNLSTKEIATLLNITIRGVEISRYRLRKKLGLARNTNLSTYLTNI